MRKATDRLNDLIRLDLDAIGAYRTALVVCELPGIKLRLTEFCRDHERHVRDLTDLVVRLEGRPAKHRDVKGIFLLGFTKLASHGDRSALLAIRGCIEITTRIYLSALHEELPKGARMLVEKNYADERRHLAWIVMALEKEVWRVEPARESPSTRGEPLRATGTDGPGNRPPTNRRTKDATSSSSHSTGGTARRVRRPRARAGRS